MPFIPKLHVNSVIICFSHATAYFRWVSVSASLYCETTSSTKTISHPGLVVSVTISASLTVLLSQLLMVLRYNGRSARAGNVKDFSPGAARGGQLRQSYHHKDGKSQIHTDTVSESHIEITLKRKLIQKWELYTTMSAHQRSDKSTSQMEATTPPSIQSHLLRVFVRLQQEETSWSPILTKHIDIATGAAKKVSQPFVHDSISMGGNPFRGQPSRHPFRRLVARPFTSSWEQPP